MSDPADTQRLVGDLLRYGVVETVDAAKARCTVRLGKDIVTGPIRWLAARAGGASHFSAPTKGEQVLLLCPEGDIRAAIVLLGVYSDANPAPGDREKLHVFKFEDGAILSYDAEAHHLAVTLPDGATAAIEASGGITIKGDVSIDGKLSVTGDIATEADVNAEGDMKAGDISLKDHGHGQVQAGGAKSGKAVAL